MDSAHALLSSSEGGIFPKPREKYALSMAGVLRGSIEEEHIGNRVSLSSVLCLPAVILRFLGGSMYSAYALQGSSLGGTFHKPREKYALLVARVAPEGARVLKKDIAGIVVLFRASYVFRL